MEPLGIRVTRRRLEPPLSRAHFRVFLDREELGVLSLSALHWVLEPGDEAEHECDTPQRVTLRRAASQDRTLYNWHKAVAAGRDGPRTLTVVQLDAPDGLAINIWQLEKALPVRWTGSSFDALSQDFGLEELEVRYSGIAWRSSV